MAFSFDSRWVAVSTVRGTVHVFPITSYGGIGPKNYIIFYKKACKHCNKASCVRSQKAIGNCFPGPVVQRNRIDNAIHQINHWIALSVCFATLIDHLQRYPTFEQLERVDKKRPLDRSTRLSTSTTLQTQCAGFTSTHLTPISFLEPPSLLVSNREERGLWERNWFEIRKSYS